VTNAKTMSENYEDHTISLGLSDTYTISPKWQVLAGVSEDIVKADKIWDTSTAYNDMLKLTTQSSFNPQAAVIYSIDKSSKIRASIARKIFIPTMKDRYSRRFNQYVPNPDLQPSKSTNYEVDYKKQAKHLTASVSAFYTVVDNAIQSVAWDQNASLQQEQNIGNIRHIGAELDLSYKTDLLSSGANYTYMSVKNTTDSSIKVLGVPKHQVFAYAQVNLNKQFALYGNMKLQDGFYSQITDYSYVKSSFTTFDTKLIYKPFASLQADVGVKNITDRVVQYDLGFPGPGREYFADLTYKF
jgi:iron complex outermembrane recepter protein